MFTVDPMRYIELQALMRLKLSPEFVLKMAQAYANGIVDGDTETTAYSQAWGYIRRIVDASHGPDEPRYMHEDAVNFYRVSVRKLLDDVTLPTTWHQMMHQSVREEWIGYGRGLAKYGILHNVLLEFEDQWSVENRKRFVMYPKAWAWEAFVDGWNAYNKEVDKR